MPPHKTLLSTTCYADSRFFPAIGLLLNLLILLGYAMFFSPQMPLVYAIPFLSSVFHGLAVYLCGGVLTQSVPVPALQTFH